MLVAAIYCKLSLVFERRIASSLNIIAVVKKYNGVDVYVHGARRICFVYVMRAETLPIEERNYTSTWVHKDWQAHLLSPITPPPLPLKNTVDTSTVS